ncbi:hypothetical protein K469DRAFT_694975 [Zopfia rhizophila CBS 207.26]|uniref:Rhodopsin domain-containing protein n=1 Tax=Zopfia rhizophila CBS 207.26 TaxID=1314779 RepID=A0A6A6DHV4_9PEZI|nr:hypothetical protein K469DRAFT_694975 [Zopfia rhizophila CBS 207.26]
MQEGQEAVHRWHVRAIQQGTKQASMFAVAIPFIFITSIVIGLRLYVRLSLVQAGLGIDDLLMLAGTIFAIGLSVANMIFADIPPGNLVPLLKANYATRLLYLVALCFVKFSILVFYTRLDPRKLTRIAVYFLMLNVAGLSIATFFILTFVCSPPSLFWDPQGQAAGAGKCMEHSLQQMPLRQKAALIALLGVGFIALAAGCVRYYYVLFLAHENDLWYYMADSLNWCSIEIYAAIICGSASTFKALLKTYLPRLWGSSRRGGSNTPRHQHNQSGSGQFAMKPYRLSPQKSNTHRKYGISGITTVEYGSQEAIVPEPKVVGAHTQSNDGITMGKEVTVERLPSHGHRWESVNNRQLCG